MSQIFLGLDFDDDETDHDVTLSHHYGISHQSLHQISDQLILAAHTYLFYVVLFVTLSLNLHYIFASILGFFSGFLVGFIVNRKWTFSQQGHTKTRLFRYFFVHIITLLVNIITIYFFTEYLLFRPEFSQFFAICLCAILNFIGSKLWVFK
tara:strand:- start:38 stop:490 length:453 start_codon:yes stop_codon:yes gene_type:complete